ncbi:damage-control phosphatase ARMT1-like isoform X2 [Haemaphysalis longicornis]
MASSVPQSPGTKASDAHEVQQKDAINRELSGNAHETHNAHGTTTKLSPTSQQSPHEAHGNEVISQAHSASGEKTPASADQPRSPAHVIKETTTEIGRSAPEPLPRHGASKLASPADQPMSPAHVIKDTTTETGRSAPEPLPRQKASKLASPEAQPAKDPQTPSDLPPVTTGGPDAALLEAPAQLPGEPHAHTTEQAELPATSGPDGALVESPAQLPGEPHAHTAEQAELPAASGPDGALVEAPAQLPGEPHAQTAEQAELPAAEKPPQRVPSWKRRFLAGLQVDEDKAAAPAVVPPEELPLPPPLSGQNSTSFAYVTVRDRLPVILTRVIDAVFRDRMKIEEQLGPEAREETKAVAGRLAKLRNEMVTNKPLLPIEDHFDDAAVWNEVLQKHTKDPSSPPRWYVAPWLYIETYFYRRIYEAFQLTTKLRDYDPFRRPKQESLHQYFKAVCELCDFVRKNTYPDAALETLKQSTYRLVEVSLWGNRCDLSLSGGAKVSGLSASAHDTERLRTFILSNHGDRLWQHLCRLRELNLAGEPQQLHCVMDNAGYELVTDLALLDFLYETGYVDSVTLHIKAIPWYVSDVTRRDLFWTLREMQDCNHESTEELSKRCQRRINEGSWSVMDDVFWTQPFDYAEMATKRPDLYAVLQSADLLLFKGDLNYRKLVGDLDWDPTVSFKHALRGFEPTFLCALRTIKADTVAGLDRVIVDRVQQQSPDWMVTGKYAVMQCAGTPVERERTTTAPPSRRHRRKQIHVEDPLLERARDLTADSQGSSQGSSQGGSQGASQGGSQGASQGGSQGASQGGSKGGSQPLEHSSRQPSGASSATQHRTAAGSDKEV